MFGRADEMTRLGGKETMAKQVTRMGRMAALGMAWVWLVGSVLGEDFRIENSVYLGSQKEPRIRSTTIFCGGVVYDYLEEPADWGQVPGPAVGGNTALFSRNDGFLYAINITTGEEVWRFEADYPILSEVAVRDEWVYFRSGAGTLFVLDLARGREQCRFELANTIYTLNPSLPADLTTINCPR